ncbi:MAG: HD domain-containing protein [Planctomycetaceae bacterium]|nr:HD domain-containing protein [Planctomycetaceae bacterium]
MEDLLRQQLLAALRREFADDPGNVDHALAVLGYAQAILQHENADATVVEAAAILHDIGVAEARRKFGRCDYLLQESEGPPLARRIMQELRMDEDAIDHVCRIVGSHHTAKDIDTPEFRILWDADWLVNLAGAARTMTAQALSAKIDEVFRTPTGKALAKRQWL